ncbi:hypothetical protein [Streptomyces rugosispiralis]|uniref:Uncharacterized protein n=1 Tax=Streptomyces rugosispiralis TaxID=2967341 RepID=A0ABT1VCY7_9ACTN|nr:hypothetical protein [Streptomyces rugosispiralis]MCQ8194639.1 hypothetical protein [Streptomyces rugosispiralis]
MSDTPSPDSPHLEGGEEQQALDTVQEVVNWYNTQIVTERRNPVPDEERIEKLKTDRQTVLEDRKRLETADPKETAQIAARYAARLKELTDS